MAFRSKRASIWVFCVAAVLVIAGVIVWFTGLHDQFFPINFGVVEPGRIYRSGQISRRIIRKTLVDHHINEIIDLSSKWEASPNAEAEKATAAELGITRKNYPLLGNGTGDPEHYLQALEELVRAQREGKTVLVHCQSGAQRSGGLVAVYRILVEGQPEEKAFAEMQTYGRSNRKLIPYLKEHLPEWKAQLAHDQVADTAAASTQH